MVWRVPLPHKNLQSDCPVFHLLVLEYKVMTIFLKTFGTSDVLVALVYLPGFYSVHFGDLDGHPNPRFHDPRPWR
jgi:hypothetical protein